MDASGAKPWIFFYDFIRWRMIQRILFFLNTGEAVKSP